MVCFIDQYVSVSLVDPDSGYESVWWEWESPVDGAIDLASAEQIAACDPKQPRGWHIATAKEPPPGLADRGGVLLTNEDIRDAKADTKTLDAIEAITGYRPQGDTIAALFVNLLLFGADPAGIDRPFTYLPRVDGMIQFKLGQIPLYSSKFVYGVSAETAIIKDTLQRFLTRYRDDALSGRMIDSTGQIDDEAHLRIAGSYLQDFADSATKDAVFADLKPATWDAADVPKTPETTITDDFLRSNQNGLGTTTEGWSWGEVVAQALIRSNHGERDSGDCIYRADSDLSSGNHQAQIDRIDTAFATRFVAPCVQFAAAATTFYSVRVTASGGSPGIYKTVAATATLLQAGATSSATPHTPKVDFNGGTITSYIDGVQDVSIADGSISGNTRTGLDFGVFTEQGDNFSASDLAAAGQPIRKRWGGMSVGNAYTNPGVW